MIKLLKGIFHTAFVEACTIMNKPKKLTGKENFPRGPRKVSVIFIDDVRHMQCALPLSVAHCFIDVNHTGQSL